MRSSRLLRSVVSSAQLDPRRAIIGGSPAAGDRTSTGIEVPAAPTLAQNRRYLFRLCGVNVPNRTVCVVRHLRQLLYIGTDLETEQDQPSEQWRIEVPVTDPLWSFPDGNVSWHLTAMTPHKPDTRIGNTTIGQPVSYRSDALDSVLLYTPGTPDPTSYWPINGGVPYGQPVGGLGTFRDMRFPWTGRSDYLGLQVEGPCLLVMYASVYQTDPDNRPNKPVGIETAGLRPEDLFVFNYPQARYTRIGGRMDTDLISLEEAANYRGGH